MAGHSKWANIKHQKKIKDQKKSKKISKVITNIKNSLKDQTTIIDPNKMKNVITIAKENNINKKIINKLIKKKNVTHTTTNLAFKNDDIFLIIETIDNQETITNIKYTLSTLFFKMISLDTLAKNIQTYALIKIKNQYNEINISNILKKINIMTVIDDSITINCKDDIKILIEKNFDLDISTMIVFKKKITLEGKKRNKLSLTLTKLLRNHGIKNIFNNIDTLAFN